MVSVYTHAGTSEFVALDDRGVRPELRRPSSRGQTSRAAADHQKVEAARLRVRGHDAAAAAAAGDSSVSEKKRRGNLRPENKPTCRFRPV